jgi:hypothetical protein
MHRPLSTSQFTGLLPDESLHQIEESSDTRYNISAWVGIDIRGSSALTSSTSTHPTEVLTSSRQYEGSLLSLGGFGHHRRFRRS